MEKDNFQNTAEFKLRDTSEMKAIENGEDGNDNYSENAKKQNIAAIIVCVVIAFMIWLIISNIKDPKGPVENDKIGEDLPTQGELVNADSSPDITENLR